ncbi:DUF4437 domain-containing protein [Agarivorans sp. Alg241-V36]|uniref:DUF4437 domain-containing protein n=1 Tax=Agarivorans sp. Alg241-V36 TaxID=2305992 RepID=UPI0013D1754D|nr:DUF4437 domain-containing protein [Agarivorans sp. Alg241-V36]
MTLSTKATMLTLSLALLSTPSLAAESSSKVVATEEINWGYLNPLRGVLSPGAADLWGDRTTNTATGMLVRFNKGFESPPHIHNITYRGIVIEGEMHNADPQAKKMWMPTGSFWTQPAGEDHTTAANGETNLIYLEIDAGPYLVKPSAENFDNGERPLNLHKDNIVWLDSNDLHDISAKGVQSTYVWGSSADMGGSMLKLPAGFTGTITTQASEFRLVLISGEIGYKSEQQSAAKQLKAGSYVESSGAYTHHITNNGDQEVSLYIRTNNRYQVK